MLDLKQRTFEFSLRVMRLAESLPNTRSERLSGTPAGWRSHSVLACQPAAMQRQPMWRTVRNSCQCKLLLAC
jgi:hypothetical protein